jgi:hypothetical protein
MTDRTTHGQPTEQPPGPDRARWLTYAQAGERFGLSSEAVRLRAKRLGWRVQPGNDGRSLVFVPDDVTVRPRPRAPVQSADQPTVQPAVQPAGQAEEIARLTALLIAANDLLERADQRAERAEKRAEQAENRADQAITRADAADADRRAAIERVDAADAERRAAVERTDAATARAEVAEARQRWTEDRVEGLRELLAEAERRAAVAEDGRKAVLRHADAMERAEFERLGRGRWARLRAAWRGE